MRLHAQTATIENGFVYLPREAPWLLDYLHELTTFPNAKYDDQADSTSQALAWIKQAAAEPEAITFMRWHAVRARLAQGHHLTTIAADFETTPRELQRLLDEYADAQEEGDELYHPSRRQEYCFSCGGELDSTKFEYGVRKYHPKCWKPFGPN
jgi:hypothetical protein